MATQWYKSEYKTAIKWLKLVNGTIPFSDIVDYLNENDVYYYGWTDMDIYLYYLQHLLDNASE